MFTQFSSLAHRIWNVCKRYLRKSDSDLSAVSQSVAPKVQSIDPVVPTVAQVPSAPKVTTITKHRVLIAEDNSINIKMMRLVLARYSFEVEVAEDGLEALEMAKKGGYDFILMDIDMPNMDGISATQAIKAYERSQGLPLTPIIALTTHDREGERESIMQAGLDEHLGKPLDMYALQKIIEKFRRA